MPDSRSVSLRARSLSPSLPLSLARSLASTIQTVIWNRVGNVGFWMQVLSLCGRALFICPSLFWEEDPQTFAKCIEIGCYLFWLCAFESVRQALATETFHFDMTEQSKLNLKKAIEVVSDQWASDPECFNRAIKEAAAAKSRQQQAGGGSGVRIFFGSL